MTPATIDSEWAQASRLAAFSVNQTAQLLGVDPRTVTQAVRAGELPSLQVGRRILIPRIPLLELLGIDTAAASIG